MNIDEYGKWIRSLPATYIREKPTPSDDALIDLATAAELLGYSKSGLRKIVRQNRIQHIQNGTGPIKFRREWLNDFKSAPSPTKPTPAIKTRKFEPTHLKRPGT